MATMTFEEFKRQMIVEAMEMQGDNYLGDEYYDQDCWKDQWEQGDSPRDSVISDMGYWES
jgi:hypothetical protein